MLVPGVTVAEHFNLLFDWTDPSTFNWSNVVFLMISACAPFSVHLFDLIEMVMCIGKLVVTNMPTIYLYCCKKIILCYICKEMPLELFYFLVVNCKHVMYIVVSMLFLSKCLTLKFTCFLFY